MQLESLITKMLLRASSGVFVHWGAYESGKSTAVRHAMQELQLHRSVRLFHGYDIAHNENVGEWLRQRLGVLPTAKSITAAFPRLPGTLIIDHYDTLCRRPDTLDALRELARDSRTSQQFNVLIIVASYERARELLREHAIAAQLLGAPDCGRWTRANLEALYDAQPPAVHARWSDDAARQELLDSATLAGTPAYLILAAANDPWAHPRRAQALDYEWRNGVLALSPDAAFEPGRFPDRDGVFHFSNQIPLATTPSPPTSPESKQAQKLKKMPHFQAFAPELSEKLNVFYELERFVVKDTHLAGVMPPAALLFATPSEAGTLYEADAMTYRFYYSFPEAVSHAVNNKAYGADFAARLRDVLVFPDPSQPVSVSDARARVLALREQLLVAMKNSSV